MQKSRSGRIPYSLAQESIELDPKFPISLMEWSNSHDSISILHRHDVLELGVCLRGHGIFIIDNRIETYEAGDLVAVGPEVFHRAKSGAGMDDLWYFLFFDPRLWDAPIQPPDISKLIKKASDPDLHALLTILADEILEERENRFFAVKGLVNAISARLLRHESIQDKTAWTPRPTEGRAFDERIAAAIDYLLASGGPQCSIAELADRCGLSESHFRKRFKDQVGMSPKHFQTKLRINTAMNLLRAKESRILDIAFDCGFESLSSFNRQFRKETGISPLQWRLQKTEKYP